MRNEKIDMAATTENGQKEAEPEELICTCISEVIYTLRHCDYIF